MPIPQEVTNYIRAELAAAGVRNMIQGSSPGLAVLSVAHDFAIWTDSAQAWWLQDGRLQFHPVAESRELRRSVFRHYHQRLQRSPRSQTEVSGTSIEEIQSAAERLRGSLLRCGITRQEMDLFSDSHVAMVYTSSPRQRLNVTVAGGHYSWPATTARTSGLRHLPWEEVARTAAEITEQLQGRPG